MSLTNYKVELSLSWNPNCILTSLDRAPTFTMTDAKLYGKTVTLSMEENASLSKLLREGFKRSIYWNKYKVIPSKTYNEDQYIRALLDTSFQGVKRLFVFAYSNDNGDRVTVDSYKKYLLPAIKIESYNIEIDERNFYGQPINDLRKQYDQVKKVSTGQGDDYTTGCLLDFAYFEKKYRLIAADLSKQKALDADSRAIQQTIFTGKASANVMVYYILEQSNETILQFLKGTTKVL